MAVPSSKGFRFFYREKAFFEIRLIDMQSCLQPRSWFRRWWSAPGGLRSRLFGSYPRLIYYTLTSITGLYSFLPSLQIIVLLSGHIIRLSLKPFLIKDLLGISKKG